MDIVDYALKYLELGWSVIPVDSRTKGGSPFPWMPYQERLPTEDEIRQWWKRWPGHGIAIITGKVSGLVVLDLDRHGENDGVRVAETVFGWEPGGPVVITGGDGLHAYYKHTGRRVRNLTGGTALAPGVEVKGDGGFVYAPPSVHQTGNEYVWNAEPWIEDVPDLPEWLAGELQSRQAPSLPPDQIEGADEIQLILLQGVDEGQRNDAASRVAGRYLSMGLGLDETMMMLKQWNLKNKPPLPVAELKKVVDSIQTREQLKRGERISAQELDDPANRSIVLQVISERFGVAIQDIYWILGSVPKMRFVCAGHEVNIRAEDVRSQVVWNKKLYAATGQVPRRLGAKAKPGWDHYLQQMTDLARANVIDPGEEATERGQVREWLNAYLESHPPADEGEFAQSPEGPVRFRDAVYFHLSSLRRYVNHTFEVRIKHHDLAQWLKSWKFERRTLQIKYGNDRRACRSMWGAPIGFLRREQAQETDEEAPF